MNVHRYIPSVLVGTAAIVCVQPQLAVANDEVNAIAEQVTVQIQLSNGQHSGSGILIAREDDTYYVLTAYHVVSGGSYRIVPDDDSSYALEGDIIRLPGVDLAIVTFESSSNYPLAELGDSEAVRVGANVYVSGWPKPGETIRTVIHQVTAGQISAIERVDDGYELIYTNPTRQGMSGGPVFNDRAQVIGVHGRAEGYEEDGIIKAWLNLGIPTATFIELAPAAYADRGQELLQAGNPEAALADFNQGLYFNSDAPEAYMGRGFARYALGQYREAIADATQALNGNSRLTMAYLLRGASYAAQGNHSRAIEDFDEAIDRDSSLADAYGRRGVSKAETGDYIGANEDVARAIELDAAIGHLRRSQVRELVGDSAGAAEDRETADRLGITFSNGYEVALGSDTRNVATRVDPTPPPVRPSPEPEPPRSRPEPDPPEEVEDDPPRPTPEPPVRPDPPEEVAVGNSNLSEAASYPATSEVLSVAISPDGSVLASGHENGTIQLRDRATGNLRQTLNAHDYPVNAVTFHPTNTSILASGSNDGTVKVWSVANGRLLNTFSHNRPESSDPVRVQDVIFSRTGANIIASDAEGGVRLWNWQSRRVTSRFGNHSRGANALAVSPDGSVLAVGSGNGEISLWQIPGGQPIATLEGHDGLVSGLEFLGDGTLASSGYDGTVKFWDTQGQRTINSFDIGIFVSDLALSPDGRVLAATLRRSALDRGGAIGLWDASTYQPRGGLQLAPGQMNALTFAPTSDVLFTGSDDSNIQQWQVR